MLPAAQRFATATVVYCTATAALQICATEILLPDVEKNPKPNTKTLRIKVMRKRFLRPPFVSEAFKTGHKVLQPV